MSMVLDHVSVQTPVVDAAVEMLRDQLGLITVRTLAAPDRHGRVYLDCSYLEVAKGTAASLALFFLRYDQFDHTRAALEGRGLRTRASLYEGIDGIRRYFADIEDAAPDFRLELDGVEGVDSKRVIAFLRTSGVGRASGIRMAPPPLTNVYDLLDGKISRVRIFLDREEALKAAGLET